MTHAYGQATVPSGGVVAPLVRCTGCTAVLVPPMVGDPAVLTCPGCGTVSRPVPAAQSPVRTGPDRQPDRSAFRADRSGDQDDRVARRAELFPPEVDGDPDPATVAALVAGDSRPLATRADIRDAALTLLSEDVSPLQVAERLHERVGQVRSWRDHAQPGGVL